MKEPGKRSMMAVSNYRHKKILEMVYQRKSVTADELAAEFGVSKITIRRDLDALAVDKLLERTRGGAMSISDLGFEEIFETKDHTAKKEKTLIGRYMASLVSENETVFLNAGSTTLEVVRHLAGKKARVVTNNAACLMLDLDPNVELILLGGDYRPQSRSLVGGITIASLQPIYSSITVLGINGVSIKRGCTTAVQLETAVNKAMLENSSGRVAVVADHTKMNCVSSFLTCPLTRVDLLVTDWMTPASFCDEMKALGVEVHRVPQE
ncbi:MAG: DeoR/GlpR family DNA-binding transcription regulator [Burkholderiaceae bacterium]